MGAFADRISELGRKFDDLLSSDNDPNLDFDWDEATDYLIFYKGYSKNELYKLKTHVKYQAIQDFMQSVGIIIMTIYNLKNGKRLETTC